MVDLQVSSASCEIGWGALRLRLPQARVILPLCASNRGNQISKLPASRPGRRRKCRPWPRVSKVGCPCGCWLALGEKSALAGASFPAAERVRIFLHLRCALFPSFSPGALSYLSRDIVSRIPLPSFRPCSIVLAPSHLACPDPPRPEGPLAFCTAAILAASFLLVLL